MKEPRVRLLLALIRSNSKLVRITKGDLEQYNLTGPEYRILITLGDEDLTLSELSQHLLRVNSNITAIIDNLEVKGLVKRIADPSDRRVIRVRLTKSGKELRTVVVPEHTRFINETLAQLTDEETEQFIRLAEKLEAICDLKTSPNNRAIPVREYDRTSYPEGTSVGILE
jgi:DNA-binding MarR family transcriptional regulator